MSQLPSAISSSLNGSVSADVLPYSVAALTGLLGFFGARYTAVARLQKTLLDASQQWVANLQTQHAKDSALILGLQDEVLRLKGELANRTQTLQSLQRNYDRLRARLDGEP